MPDTEEPVLSLGVKLGLLFIGWFVGLVTVGILAHDGVVSASAGGIVQTILFGILFFGALILGLFELGRRGRGGLPSPRQQRRAAEKRSRALASGQPDTGSSGTPFVVRVFALAGMWFLAMWGLSTARTHHVVTPIEAGGILLGSVLAVLFALIVWSVVVSDRRQHDGVGAQAGRGGVSFARDREAAGVSSPPAMAAGPMAPPFAPPPETAPPVARPPVAVVPLAPLRPLVVAEQPRSVDLGNAERVNEILAEVEGFPGMAHVIEQIRGDAARGVADAVRRAHGEPTAAQGLHSLFIGPPGTGKTMIAEIQARVFYATGSLPTDTIVRVGGADLLAKWVGHTSTKVHDLVNQARGGVLFIDEAYALAPRGSVEFSSEATTELMRAMADPEQHFAVVAAGYEDEMHEWLASNPGLAERFSRTLVFPAYDGPTLARIADVMVKQDGLALDVAGAALLTTHLYRLASAPPSEWANGRSVRRILDTIYTAQAIRLTTSGRIADAAARAEITVGDVAAVVTR